MPTSLSGSGSSSARSTSRSRAIATSSVTNPDSAPGSCANIDRTRPERAYCTACYSSILATYCQSGVTTPSQCADPNIAQNFSTYLNLCIANSLSAGFVCSRTCGSGQYLDTSSCQCQDIAGGSGGGYTSLIDRGQTNFGPPIVTATWTSTDPYLSYTANTSTTVNQFKMAVQNRSSTVFRDNTYSVSVDTTNGACRVPGQATSNAADPTLTGVGAPAPISSGVSTVASTFSITNATSPGLATIFQNFETVAATPTGWEGNTTAGAVVGVNTLNQVRTGHLIETTDNNQVLKFTPPTVTPGLALASTGQVYDLQFTLTIFNSWGGATPNRIAVVTEGEDRAFKPDGATACTNCPNQIGGRDLMVRMNRSFATVPNPPFLPTYRDGPTALDSNGGGNTTLDGIATTWAETEFGDSRTFSFDNSGVHRPGYQGVTLTTMAALQDGESTTDGILKDSVYRIIIPEIRVGALAANSFRVFIFSPGATPDGALRKWAIDNVVFQPRRSISRCGIQYGFQDSAGQQSRYCLRFLAPWTCRAQGDCFVMPIRDPGALGFFSPLSHLETDPAVTQQCP